MISFLVAYKDLLKTRKEYTLGFFEMMDEYIKQTPRLQCIVCDYGSSDGIKEFLTSYESEYTKVPINPHHWLNQSKCYNHGFHLHAKNDIITTCGVDMRFDLKFIETVIKIFHPLDEIVLRTQCIKLNKENKIEAVTFAPYFLHKKNIYNAGGWDERMYGWGKEEDDLIERIHRFQEILEFRVRGLALYHLWHDDDYKKRYDTKNLKENYNYKILIENIKTRGVNIINSYWNKNGNK